MSVLGVRLARFSLWRSLRRGGGCILALAIGPHHGAGLAIDVIVVTVFLVMGFVAEEWTAT